MVLLAAELESSNTRARAPTPRRATAVDADVDAALAVCRSAAATKGEDSDDVVAALLALEKGMRAAAKASPDVSARTKKVGKINYFPLKAVQTFDVARGRISNSILVGDFPLIRFFGDFEWLMDRRRVEFDFDQIALFNFGRIDLPKGGAAKIGASTGLGSENNVKMVEESKKSPSSTGSPRTRTSRRRAAAAAASRSGSATSTTPCRSE
ncbi:hypothetical protein JL722_8560 [Aureococcus anophagefferens]|nr:hypothetical protein JL722_8560 [Aureococcus anophagefferens]